MGIKAWIQEFGGIVKKMTSKLIPRFDQVMPTGGHQCRALFWGQERTLSWLLHLH